MTFKRSECLISLKSRFNVRSKQQLIDYGYGFTPKKQKQKNSYIECKKRYKHTSKYTYTLSKRSGKI